MKEAIALVRYNENKKIKWPTAVDLLVNFAETFEGNPEILGDGKCQAVWEIAQRQMIAYFKKQIGETH